MRSRFRAAWILPLSASLLACPSAPTSQETATPAPAGTIRLGEPISPLPAPPRLDPRKVELGRRLFHDPSLSADGRTACSTCHPLDRAGADGLRRSRGVGGQESPFNAPTVFNVSLSFRQFWDGRAATLAEQLDDARKMELKVSWAEVVARVNRYPHYRAEFAALYPGGLGQQAVLDAMVTFERSLLTPDSPFDRYLRGEGEALPPDALAGYGLFKRYGCVTCHQGVAVGANMFQRFGAFGSYFADRGETRQEDLGRFNVTGKDEDRHVFKVPSLRNVALTAPYFHDGSVAALQEAVRLMARYQLGRDLGEEEIRLLVAFLHSLTGEYQGVPLDRMAARGDGSGAVGSTAARQDGGAEGK